MNYFNVALQVFVHGLSIISVFKDIVTADESFDVVVAGPRVTSIIDMAIGLEMGNSSIVPVNTVSSEYSSSFVGKFLDKKYWIICNDLIVNHEFMTL